MIENVFYFAHFNKIGGVESWLYYLSREYKDFVVYYRDGDFNQIDRIGNNVEIHKFKGEKIKCKRFFLSYACDILDYVEAEEYICVIHADYKAMGLRPNLDKRITKYIGVSKVVCDSFEEISGKKCELMYNFVSLDKPKKVLRLISATRLTAEKGRNRIITLGKHLDNAGIPYIWFIFTNDSNIIRNDHLVYMKPRMDISNYIADCDYLVQLSDTESYCLSVVEALTLGTPVIVTDLPVFDELGLDESNSIKLKLDMSNIDVDEICKGKKDFKWVAPKSEWGKYLNKESSYDPNREVWVQAKATYDDIALGKRVIKDDKYPVSEKRKNYLTDRELVDTIK